MTETPAQLRQDIPPLEWRDDLLEAFPAASLKMPSYRVLRTLGGYRVAREKSRSRKFKRREECHRAIVLDYTASFLRKHNAPNAPWLPMDIAPVTGWGILVRMRGDLASLLEDHRYNAWAQKQIVVRISRLNDDPAEGTWDMCAPSGTDGIPGGWFTGWRPLISPLPYDGEDLPLMIAAE